MTDFSNVIRILPPMKSGDDLFSALEVLPEYTGAVYGAVAYRFGMEDGVRLCVEMEKITCLEQ